MKVVPDAADAYLGLGTANYIIGSLPGPKKFFLGFAGIHGDKMKGMEQLEIAANRGHYLRPFAKILLALTTLREKKEVARTEFAQLAAEFPENPLFARELSKLNASPVAAAFVDQKCHGVRFGPSRSFAALGQVYVSRRARCDIASQILSR